VNGFKGFLLRGAAAGASGGAAAALFIRLVTETTIGHALRFEDAAGLGLPPGEEPMFSRGTQQWGGMLAALILGVALGVAFGVTVAALHHRIRATSEFGRGARVALAGFVAVVLIPGLKYPPSPPTVGDPDTIDQRTTSYLLLVGASIIVVLAAWVLWERLAERGWSGAPRFVVGGGAFLVLTAALLVAFPASPDRIAAPANEAAPALVVADDAPPEVMAAMLRTAREVGDTPLRDPAAPDEPLDPSTVGDAGALAGTPVAVSTAELVPHGYATVIWRFRLASFAGLALLWATMAAVFGLLADPHRARAGATAPAPA
jgi:hypothetical protein